MIHPPDHVREAFAKMTENDVDARISIKKPARHQTQRMDRGFDAESPCRTHKPRMTVVNGFALRQRITRVEIQGDVKLFQLCPERGITRVVQINDRVRIANL